MTDGAAMCRDTDDYSAALRRVNQLQELADLRARCAVLEEEVRACRKREAEYVQRSIAEIGLVARVAFATISRDLPEKPDD